ncbi:LysR family transcriptional regulator [Burkholderia diffusa]|uniref:LysR family transcriptional regulator n=1 Tax=Burkholderia diffusa TaxID=488732 RepID=UPI00158F3790|nr:LysR family transcriptional regulator [Burkholderia diffusa]
MDHLQSIRAFVAVAKEGGFSVGASRLSMSTAVASRLVLALEARLGARLLHRSTRHLSLTEIGKLYLARVAPLLSAIDDVEGQLSSTRIEPEGMLRVLAPVAFGLSTLSTPMNEFVRRFPLVRPDVRLSDTPVDLEHGRIDVALLPDCAQIPSRYALHRLAVYETVLVASPHFSKATHIEPRSGHDYGDGHARPSVADDPSPRWDDGRTESQNWPVRTSNLEMIRQMVVAGMCVAALPSYLVDLDLLHGTLIRRTPSRPLAPTTFVLLHPRQTCLPTATRAFVDFALNAFSTPSLLGEAAVEPHNADGAARDLPEIRLSDRAAD